MFNLINKASVDVDERQVTYTNTNSHTRPCPSPIKWCAGDIIDYCIKIRCSGLSIVSAVHAKEDVRPSSVCVKEIKFSARRNVLSW